MTQDNAHWLLNSDGLEEEEEEEGFLVQYRYSLPSLSLSLSLVLGTCKVWFWFWVNVCVFCVSKWYLAILYSPFSFPSHKLIVYTVQNSECRIHSVKTIHQNIIPLLLITILWMKKDWFYCTSFFISASSSSSCFFITQFLTCCFPLLSALDFS